MACAQDLDSVVRELSRQIDATAQRQEINLLTVRNASSLTDAEAAQVTRVHSEREDRLRPVRPGAERTAVQVTLSENAQSYLWRVAAIGDGAKQEVLMLSVARPLAPAPAAAALSIREEAALGTGEADSRCGGLRCVPGCPRRCHSVSFYRAIASWPNRFRFRA